MNIKILKGAFIVALFSIFSSFSSFAMRAEKRYVEKIEIFNKTNMPMFINIAEFSIPIPANDEIWGEVTEMWVKNSDATKTLKYTLSRTAKGEPFGTTKFLMDKDERNLKVILNIGSYSKTYDFDIEGIGYLWFVTVLTDDSTKAASNFEKSTFELRKNSNEKIASLQEQEMLPEHQKARIERERLLDRPEIQRIKTPEQLLPMLPRK